MWGLWSLCLVDGYIPLRGIAGIRCEEETICVEFKKFMAMDLCVLSVKTNIFKSTAKEIHLPVQPVPVFFVSDTEPVKHLVPF